MQVAQAVVGLPARPVAGSLAGLRRAAEGAQDQAGDGDGAHPAVFGQPDHAIAT